MSRRIDTFFYGSFMDRNVLKRLDIAVDHSVPATLAGYQIELRPRVNLHRSDRHMVYGSVMSLTHSELAHLYGLGQKELQERGIHVPAGQAGDVYQPEPVIVSLLDGSWRPVMCYMSDNQAPAPPSNEYVQSVVDAARTLRLPDWYVAHLESFRRTD